MCGRGRRVAVVANIGLAVCGTAELLLLLLLLDYWAAAPAAPAAPAAVPADMLLMLHTHARTLAVQKEGVTLNAHGKRLLSEASSATVDAPSPA